MHQVPRTHSSVRFLGCATVPLLVSGLLIVSGTTATATDSTTATRISAQQDKVITLPGATSAEGIAAGAGSTFYAGDLYKGDIYRGDIRSGTAELLIDAPDGRLAAGMRADVRHDLLFVAGAQTGQAYVYNTRTGATVATYQLGTRGTSIINDVAVTRDGAWFTDSLQAKLYFVPVGKDGTPGTVRTLDVTGPAAGTTSGRISLNGIQATADGRTLVVAHLENERLYTVDPDTGASTLIEGVEVPHVDGLVLDGRRVWAVQNADNKIARIKLSHDLSHGTLEKEITSPDFGIPTSAALFGHRLAAVNGHLNPSAPGTPGTSPTYEVVVTKS